MIDKELAAFLQEGLAIHIGTRNARLEPNGARVVAVRVEDDGTHVVAYVPKLAAPQRAARSRGQRPGGARVRAAGRRPRVPGERRVRRRMRGRARRRARSSAPVGSLAARASRQSACRVPTRRGWDDVAVRGGPAARDRALQPDARTRRGAALMTSPRRPSACTATTSSRWRRASRASFRRRSSPARRTARRTPRI